jgi:hypothetical protein
VALGQEEAPVVRADDKPYFVNSAHITLIEFVRDPQTDRFRLRAEVRQVQGVVAAQVGLFVAHQEYASLGGRTHFFTRLTYDDVNDLKEAHKRFPPPPPGVQAPVFTGNQVNLMPHFYGASENGAVWAYTLSGRCEPLIEFAGYGELPWRQLTLDVSPDGVRAWWGPKDQAVGVLSSDYLLGEAQRVLRNVQRREPTNLFARGLDPTYAPRGSLGLFVYGGAAYFRRVVLEPLPGEE